MNHQQTVLVTGASGFIGRELVRQLSKKNVYVRATDIIEPKDEIFKLPNVAFVQADICEPNEVTRLFGGVDRVFHTAGVCNLTSPFEKLEPININAVGLISSIALQHSVSCFVHFSSTSIYGAYAGVPFNEQAPCLPKDNYGKSKLLGEEKIKSNMAKGLPAIILRPCTVYGPGCNDGAGKVFSRPGTIAGIPGNGKQKIANIRVEDVAASALYLSERQDAFGKIFNLADNSQPKLEDALAIAAKTFGSNFSRKHIPLFLMKVVALVEGAIAKRRHEIPDLEYEAIKYLYDDYIVDNTQLINSGYQLVYPDFSESMKDLATRINN
jgi:UDP-glucose 4-epimerase